MTSKVSSGGGQATHYTEKPQKDRKESVLS